MDGRHKSGFLGNSLAVQWLGLGAFTAHGQGSIPGGQKKKKCFSGCYSYAISCRHLSQEKLSSVKKKKKS